MGGHGGGGHGGGGRGGWGRGRGIGYVLGGPWIADCGPWDDDCPSYGPAPLAIIAGDSRTGRVAPQRPRGSTSRRVPQHPARAPGHHAVPAHGANRMHGEFNDGMVVGVEGFSMDDPTRAGAGRLGIEHYLETGSRYNPFGADDDDSTPVRSPDLPSPSVPTLDLPNYLGLLDRSDYEMVPITIEDIDYDPLVASGRAGTRRVGIDSWMESRAAGNAFGRENDYMVDTNHVAAIMGVEFGCDDVDSWLGGLKK